jgi:ferrous iron transport protein B
MLHLWDKAKHFIEKAFTIIFASTIVIWFLSNFGWDWKYVGEEGMDSSILASLGKLIQPLFTPLGFGSQLTSAGWVFAVACITGLIAKENVIATLGALAGCISANFLGTTEEGIYEVTTMISATGITLPALISFIAFNMTTIPCFAAVATTKGELTKKQFRGTLLFWLVTSYIVSMMINLIGTYWWTAFIFILIAIIGIFGIKFYNKYVAK